MPAFDHSNFADRIKNAAAAKAASVARHSARPGPDDPGVKAKAAERRGVADARVAREAEKERAKLEQLAIDGDRQRVRDEEEQAAALARGLELEELERAVQAAKRERAKNALLNLADQKDLRDARYAARKARQKQIKKG